MIRFLRYRVFFLLCMVLGLGFVFSGVTQAEITVSEPVIDSGTGGNFNIMNYGECFFLLANPHLDRCEEEVGPDFYSVTPDRYRSPSDSNGCFHLNYPDYPKSDFLGETNVCFGNTTGPPYNALPVEFDGFRVDDFRVYRIDDFPYQALDLDIGEPDIAFAWSTIAGSNGGQYQFIPCDTTLPDDLNRFTTFDSEFVEDTAVTEIEINQTGSITLAYYFVNAANVCRALTYELFINDAPIPIKFGIISDFQFGKYLVFEVEGLDGPATIRLESKLFSDPDLPPTWCPTATIPGINAHISGVFISNCVPEPPQEVCSIGDYVWEDANRDGCQDPDERAIEGVEVKLFENCDNPIQIASTTTSADGFYEFTGLDCDKGYRVKFGDAGAIYKRTLPFQDCSSTDPIEPSEANDSDCSQEDGFSGCVTFPNPGDVSDNPTIDCGYVCGGEIGNYVWLDEDEDGCQNESNTGIAGVDVTLYEDCVDKNNPKPVKTDAGGFYEFGELCPGQYLVEFGDDRPNTSQGVQCVPGDFGESAKKDSNCGPIDLLRCVELTRDNTVDMTIDCGKVGPCIELEKQVSGDGGVTFFDADNCTDADVPFTADDAEYKLIVTNCGKEAVNLDKIVDFNLVIDLDLDPTVTIQPGESVEFTNNAGQTYGLLEKVGACPDPEGEFDNTATVSGTGTGSGEFVEATDPACVKCGPCIEILKNVRDAENQTGNYQPADTCEDAVPINNGAEYRLTVTNCGPEALMDVVINDVKLGIVNFPAVDSGETIGVGESKTFFFDDIAQLLQSDLCDEISELQFLNVSDVEGTGVESNITVTAENSACVECQPECDIKVTKTCAIPPPPPGPEVSTCDDLKDVTGLTMIWRGDDGVNIKTETGQVIEGINKGDIVFLDTPKDETGNDVDVAISGAMIGMSKFHISCSDQDMNGFEDCEKPQGDGKSNDSNLINLWEFGGMTGEKGQFTCPDAQPKLNGFPIETEECEFTPQPDGGNCDDIKDITALTLVWNGPSGLNIESEVGQVINGINNGDVIVLDTPKDDTGNDVDVTLSGSVNEDSKFHISCSDDEMNGPEDCGTAQGDGKDDDDSLNNQWLLGGMTGEKGSFGCPGVPGGSDSAEVVYGIRVENSNNEQVDVKIVDVKLGIDQTETIPAYDFFELVTDPITIMPDDDTNEFTNTVVVTAETLSGATCEASDSVTVKRNPPPPPPVSCSDIKDITAVSVVWTGPETVKVVMESGEMFENVMTGNKITFQEANTGKDVEMSILEAVTSTLLGKSKFHVSCSDEDMNGSEDCGKNQGDGKDDDDSLNNEWLLDGMTGENGSFNCNLPNTGVVAPSGGAGVTGAATLDLGDDKKVKWELTNNGYQDVFVTRVVVTWPSQHGQVKKFKLEGDFAKDVFDDASPTAVPDDKAFESDPNKRKLKMDDHKKLEIEFTEKFKDHVESDFTLSVEFDTGEILIFP